jgi:hypothetical protein
VSGAVVAIAQVIQWPIALAASLISAGFFAVAERHLHRRRLAGALLRLSLRSGEFGRRMLQGERPAN